MKRTQVQLPEPLYREVKRVAEMQDWSITEVLRRGAEYIVSCFPSDKRIGQSWVLPKRDLGEFCAPVERWREPFSDK